MVKKKFIYKADCKFFRGDVPCKPHKNFGVVCSDCNYYIPQENIILIIKLGAIGDVIRTTPLLHRIFEEHPRSAVWWLTLTPEVVPSVVDRVLPLNLESILLLQETEFYKVINLDKDPYACALTKSLKAKEKYGFTLENGKPAPVNNLSYHKFLTGVFDPVNKNNTKSYLEEIFEILGWKYNGEEYILEVTNSIRWNIPNEGKPIIGLNTGCGGRWVSRLWPEHNWIELIHLLNENHYFPMLLGGEAEDEKNRKISEQTGAYYPGHFDLKRFISLVNQCDLVVTAVTMALHIAIGLKKKVVLFNNIFNRHEFELFGRGVILEPEKPCQCFFSPTCLNTEYFCMDYLFPDKVFQEIKNLLPYSPY
ncbi:MAG: ADP-heptose:LPS heptosyltransferase [Candidatus Kapaibacterium sp.]|nr:MAG: ADP-heptose:LPS heptosyltransferase [Candidatus Kapabacteria bacterium]